MTGFGWSEFFLICFAVGFSGDFKQAQKHAAEAKNGVEVAYAIPKEGAQLWFDNLAIPKDALPDGGPFDPELIRNEENLLLERLARSGRRFLHAPELFVHHERRSSASARSEDCTYHVASSGRAQASPSCMMARESPRRAQEAAS